VSFAIATEKCVEPFAPSVDIIKREELPVYRAGLSRTFTLVAAPPSTAAAMGDYLCDVCASHLEAENDPTAQVFCRMGRVIAARQNCRLRIPLFSVGLLAEEKETVGQARACATHSDRAVVSVVADAIEPVRQVE
jgi:hypothetical protein